MENTENKKSAEDKYSQGSKNYENSFVKITVKNFLEKVRGYNKQNKSFIKATFSTGGGVGGCSITGLLLNFLGVPGLSAAGLTSALKILGSIIGGGMLSGVFIAVTPIILGVFGGSILYLSIMRSKLVKIVKEAFEESKYLIDNLECRKDNLYCEEYIKDIKELKIISERCKNVINNLKGEL